MTLFCIQTEMPTKPFNTRQIKFGMYYSETLKVSKLYYFEASSIEEIAKRFNLQVQHISANEALLSPFPDENHWDKQLPSEIKGPNGISIISINPKIPSRITKIIPTKISFDYTKDTEEHAYVM